MKPVNEMSLDELREEVTERRAEAGLYEPPATPHTGGVRVGDYTDSQPSLTLALFRSIGKFGLRKSRMF